MFVIFYLVCSMSLILRRVEIANENSIPKESRWWICGWWVHEMEVMSSRQW